MTTGVLAFVVCLATSIWMVPCLKAGDHLPGSSVPPAVVFQDSVDFVAVCIAESEARLGEDRAGARSVVQRFRLVGLVVGRTGGRSAGEMHYRMSADGFERTVRNGERVIWLARSEADWQGVHVLKDTPDNRDLVYSHFSRAFNSRYRDALEVRVETPSSCFARGQPIPVRVQIDNTSEPAIPLWSTFSALQFEVLAEDGEPIQCRKVRPPRFDRTAPLIVKQYRGPSETADLADLCDWLPSRTEQRSYTLFWRSKVRLDDRKAEPFEIVARPIRLTVRDPSITAWGAEKDGAACGLGAERYNVSVGDRMNFHFGVRSDSATVGPDLHFYRYCIDDEVYFTFRNTATGTAYQRDMDGFNGGPPYTPRGEDFLRLRDHPMILTTIPVRLLHESGEQIPAGQYEVRATYEARQTERAGWGGRTWKVLRGPLVSGPITVRVEQADPESVEIRTNSAIELKSDQGPCYWEGSREDPIVLRVLHRPGYSFHVNAKTSVAIGSGAFELMGEGGYGGFMIQDNFVSSTWSTFPGGLGSNACRALATGELLKVRVDVTLFETADTYARWSSPDRGDSRIVWQGRLETRRP